MDGQYFLDLLFKIVEGILVASAPVVVAYVVAWINKQVAFVQAKIEAELTDQQQYFLSLAAKVAVDAAEQMKLAGLISAKKEKAVVMAQDFLNAHGINIDVAVVESAIEAAVLKLNGKASS